MNRSWNILNWNVRGIKSSDKWRAISNKIEESGCSILCLQEIKREFFYSNYIRNFCPKRLNKFEFVPSMGASEGSLICWNENVFKGHLLFQNNFSLTVQFTSVHSNATWILTNIYGPCEGEAREQFLDWFSNIQIQLTWTGLSWGTLTILDTLITETLARVTLKICRSSMRLSMLLVWWTSL